MLMGGHALIIVTDCDPQPAPSINGVNQSDDIRQHLYWSFCSRGVPVSTSDWAPGLVTTR